MDDDCDMTRLGSFDLLELGDLNFGRTDLRSCDTNTDAESREMDLDLKEAIQEAETHHSITPLIKKELKYKILTRRLSEGATDLRVVFETPRKYSTVNYTAEYVERLSVALEVKLTEEEKEKIERRKQRNRISANNSRIRRKQRLAELELEAARLSRDNESLTREINELKKTRGVLKQHIYSCKRLSRTKHRIPNHLFSEEVKHTRWNLQTRRFPDVLPEVSFGACQEVLG